MAAATNSLQKNLEDILQRNEGRSANRTSIPEDSQQGGDTEQGQAVGANLAENSNNTTPIYYKEQTVGNDDKLYDVMILIKPKNATISV